MVTAGTDRGQMLLLAAITLAVVLLGMAVLLNAAVTTEVRAPDDPSTDLDEAERIASDVEAGLSGLAARINLDGQHAQNAALTDAFEANDSTFANYVEMSMGRHRASLLDHSFANVTLGAYVADGDRTTDLRFRTGSPSDHSTRVDRSDATTIRGMTFSLNKTEIRRSTVDDVAVGFQFWGDSDCQLFTVEAPTVTNNVTVQKQDIDCTAPNSAIENSTSSDTTEVAECSLDDSTQFARVEFREEPTSDDVCHVDPFVDLDPVDGSGYGFSIRNPTSVEGGYSYLLGSQTFRGYGDDDYYADSPDDDPYALPVVWSFDLTLEQRARASSRSVTSPVVVYDDPDNVAAMGVPWT
ncbi:MAG: hypothetical protein ACLFM8_04500 [Halobacteriales archaeon]